VSVVVPVFNGAETVAEVVERTREALAACSSRHEIVLVNDGSGDDSWERIAALSAAADVRGIDLARNYGQHNALLAGIRAARCELIVTIDDDLQNPPEEIPRLLEAIRNDCDVVYGVPAAKQQDLGRRVATQLVVRALGLLGGRTAPMVSAFRAFRADLREGFAAYTGPDVSIDGLLTWRTDRFRSVRVRHDRRRRGESNYSTVKLVRHALTMITAFSTRPLRIATSLGFLAILFGIAVFAYVLIRFFTEGDGVPGFPFLASIISIFAGAQLFAIGVIGEYLARMHVRVMSRPSYSVRAEVGPGGPSPRRPGAEAAAGDANDLCRVLAWDSEFWGFQIARVVPKALDREAAMRVENWCTENGIACAYLLTDAADGATAAAAAAVGFEAVDTRIALERPPGLPPPEGAEPSGLRLRSAGDADGEAVAAIAREAHTDTRFFFDPRFPDARAAEMYEAWARRWVEDGVDLVVAERDGEVIGYVLTDGDPPRISLMAVAAGARGDGIGRALLAAAARRAPNGALAVVTQARNVDAMRLYEACGFRVAATQTWYHRWS
jgi:glycosyltransferase involved in cell wall biosynthesis/ribosomal protein S18 acetylase RimI-like enzyme